MVFQFTHPVRGATPCPHQGRSQGGRFNSRTPCGVRLATPITEPRSVQVSIHAPRAGCDRLSDLAVKDNRVSIHAPRAGCDNEQDTRANHHPVSIHAPRAGCDRQSLAGAAHQHGFNSRTPCGVRPSTKTRRMWKMEFQFTHPVRGATEHPLVPASSPQGFNSRTPCGVRLRCPKIRINRGLDVDPLRIEDYKRVCRSVGGDCEAVCLWVSTYANSLPFY